AAMNAASKVFGGEKSAGCYFHFRKSLMEKIKTSGQQTRYNTDKDFSKRVNMVAALAFLPPREIKDAFEELKSSFPSDEGLNTFLDYFEENYISRTRLVLRGVAVHRDPLFPPSFWSLAERTVLGIHRTQNVVESWHNRLNVIVNRKNAKAEK